MSFTVKTHVPHGAFSYDVDTQEQAFEHAAVIIEKGYYRHVRQDGSIDFFPVNKVNIKSIDGPLSTVYNSDIFSSN